jgi:hypothetical protein
MQLTCDYLIIGAGPSGLLAHSYLKHVMKIPADRIGHVEANSFSTTRKMYSSTAAFYVHRHLHPLVTDETISVAWMIDGPRQDEDFTEQYSEKVYGEQVAGVSIDEKMAFGYKLNIDHMLASAGHFDYDRRVTKIYIQNMGSNAKRVDTDKGTIYAKTIINTLPLPSFLKLITRADYGGPIIVPEVIRNMPYEAFRSKPIYIRQSLLDSPLGKNNMIIIYNYDKEVGHYRTTLAGSLMTREYMNPAAFGSQGIKLTPGKVFPVDKTLLDLDNTKQLLRDSGMYMVGRYANWEKGYKLDQSWQEMSRLKGLKL